MCSGVLRRLRLSYAASVRYEGDVDDIASQVRFLRERGLRGWEAFFVPEEWFYDDVLKHLEPDDVVFDVGAGDLRFDLIMADKVKKVYAVEVNPDILARALRIIRYDLPRNLIVICANALDVPLPQDVTTITILMIHRKWEIPKEWLGKKIIYTTPDGVKVIEGGQGGNG